MSYQGVTNLQSLGKKAIGFSILTFHCIQGRSPLKKRSYENHICEHQQADGYSEQKHESHHKTVNLEKLWVQLIVGFTDSIVINVEKEKRC